MQNVWRVFPLVLVLLASCMPQRPPGEVRTTQSQSVLGADEIREAAAPDAYTVVRSRRPQWLRSVRATTISGNDGVVVYYGNARMGGIDALRQIPAANIRSMEFLRPATAQQRFGVGHLNGAIVVTPET
jgi:hypothetical protein